MIIVSPSFVPRLYPKIAMPRRAPPTALRLHSGPTPPRTHPKHSLPSIPQPTFYPFTSLPPPRATTSPRPTPRNLATLVPLDIPLVPSPPSSRSSSPRSGNVSERFVRGPWDHSGTISSALPFDVESMLKPLKPVAVGFGGMRC